jgi:hypothetical protein
MTRFLMFSSSMAMIVMLGSPCSAWAGPPAAPAFPPEATLRITVDNVLEALFVNGRAVAVDPETAADWLHTSTVTFALQPGRNVIAVRAADQGVIAGLLAELTVGCSVLDSGEAWRVHHDAPEGWEQPGFDDSSWKPASVYGNHPGGVWGTRVQGMDGSTATWIWNEVNTLNGEIEPTVYFRFTFEVVPGWVVSGG